MEMNMDMDMLIDIDRDIYACMSTCVHVCMFKSGAAPKTETSNNFRRFALHFTRNLPNSPRASPGIASTDALQELTGKDTLQKKRESYRKRERKL